MISGMDAGFNKSSISQIEQKINRFAQYFYSNELTAAAKHGILKAGRGSQ